MTEETEEQVKHAVSSAIEKLLDADSFLLQNNVNERSISHKLACYIQELFADWQVDCEYNRDHDDTKRLNLPTKNVKTNDTNAQTVYPDIIIHRRNTGQNLLVIEIKKTTNPETIENDLEKLDAFKNQLGYRYALFLKLETGKQIIGNPEQRWV